jgi:hypothetical protein
MADARRRSAYALVVACVLTGCASTAEPLRTPVCAAQRKAGVASGQLERAALPPLEPRTYRCGDVQSTGAAPFAAIRRLATTREPVRILVYGQSLSEQSWWWKTKRWLEQTYPNGTLIMQMHAHGGCSSQCLIGHEPYFKDGSQFNHLPEDVFAFHPDLIIFHVFGDHVDYGYVLKAFTQGCDAFDDYRTWDGKDVPEVHCTALQRALAAGYRKPEVLVQNDFVLESAPASCPEHPNQDNWPCFMNERVIPEHVARYGYRLQDNFHGWPRYLTEHAIDPETLLGPDHTHLSDPTGNEVMYRMTIPQLCFAP